MAWASATALDVTSCPRCASPDIRQATTSDGVVAGSGELLLSVCRLCGFRGAPLHFDDEEAYQVFRASLAGESSGAEAPDADEDELPADLQELLDTPVRRRSLFTAVFMGSLGVAMTLGGGAFVALLLLSLVGLAFVAPGALVHVGFWYSLAIGLLGLGLGLTFLRGARRLWRRDESQAT